MVQKNHAFINKNMNYSLNFNKLRVYKFLLINKFKILDLLIKIKKRQLFKVHKFILNLYFKFKKLKFFKFVFLKSRFKLVPKLSLFKNLKLRQNTKKKIGNYFMLNGKKCVFDKFFLKTFKQLQKIDLKNSTHIVKSSIINTVPLFNVRVIRPSKKKKKKVLKEYPFFLNETQRIFFSFKTLLENSKKKGSSVVNLFKNELLKSSKNESNSTKVKITNQKLSVAKKKFLNFRWSPTG